MKKLALLSLALLMAFAATSFAAPERVNQLDWGLYGAGSFNENGIDDAGYVGTNLSYGITPWFAIGVESGWQEPDTDQSEVSVGTVNIMGDLIFRLHDSIHNIEALRALVPYAIVGLGVAGTYVTDEDGAAPTNNGDDVHDTTFAYKIGGGADWFINDNWALNFEVSYVSSDPDLPGTQFDNNNDYWLVGGGLKFVF